MKGEARGPIAVVGIGCRFPGGASDPASFWRLLESGVDPVAPMPAGRFDVERFVHPEPGTPGKIVTADGGFLEDIDKFDAAFFGLSPREARKIDPQHRLLLEVAWEALEDAGIPASSLAGRRVGVYVGVWSGEYENVMYRTPEELDFHSITGGGRYAASGRISYTFDLRGPALTVDTGCSASLVALHLARQAIESGEADLAIVGAANLVLQPHVNVGYSRSGMLSAGARCRFGDAGAAGYVRSDGAAAIVLKPLSAARADGDPVRGVLLTTGVNADGRGSGQLATPSADAQAELLETVYARAGVDPASVAYVEAHGTGTRAGDPVELEALGRVLGRGRPVNAPLIVGSVKSVIGHTEAAAGMAGLIKTLLALEHRRIPPNLHLNVPNETIAWGKLRVEIPTVMRDWPAGAPLIAGVSSFGITGTNAHAVVVAANGNEAITETAAGEAPTRVPSVIAVSARTPAALSEGARSLHRWLSARAGTVRVSDLAYTTTCRREQHEHRLAIVAESIDEVIAGLDDHAAEESSGRAISGVVSASAPSIGFVFSGQGSQWLGMGRDLLANAPVFAEWMEQCDAALRPQTGWSLLDVIRDDDAGRLERVDVVQPTLTCVQIALAQQLRAWGVEPRAVVGHSMGEVAASHCAGALPLEDALRVVAVRSRLLSDIAGAGAMALVDLTEAEVTQLLDGMGGRIAVAAVNGPRSTVISGDPTSVNALLEQLDDDGVFCRRVKVDVASHSAQTDPLLAPLRNELNGLDPAAPYASFYSTARPGAPADALLDADYWVDNLRRPVRLMATVQSMIADGIDTFIEIAPHPVLLSSLGDIAADADAQIRAFAGLRREEPEMRRSVELLARLHVCGVPVAWRALTANDARVISTPSYPWQRERHWLDAWEDWSSDGTAAVSVQRPENADAMTHIVEWAALSQGADTSVEGAWLLVSDGAGVARQCAELLRARGATPMVVDPAELPGALQRMSVSGQRLAGVIHLAGLDVASDGAATADVPGAGALATAHALLAADVSAPTWWVTRGVQTLPGRAGDLSAWPQAATWGLARTLWQEHPELDAHLVDVDGDTAACAEQVVTALMSLCGEPQVAFAGGTPYGARIEPAGRDALDMPATWRADGACLITGGLGALGLIAAEELVSGGARRLILMTRMPMPPRREWSKLESGALADRVAGVQRLEALGASVHLAAVDVGDAAALAGWLADYRAEGWPPIRWVVHCAGVLDNHLVRDLTAASLRDLMRGKPLAAENLGRLLPDVERTVYFSSTVPVLPQAGQANYAAANAALDAMAAARTAAGRPTASLAWGVWKDAGLVAHAQVRRYVETMEASGLGSLEPAEARSLFRWAAGTKRAHLVLAPIDWAAARGRIANRPGARFYANVLGADAISTGPSLRAVLDDMPAGSRRSVLAEHLRALVARVLDVTPDAVAAGQLLGRQGLDSLMAMEFRNRLEAELELRLPASLTWNYPTLDRMAEHLLERLAPEAPGSSERVDAYAAVQPSMRAAALHAVAGAVPVDGVIGLDPRIRAEVSELSDEEILKQLRDA